MTPSWSQPSQPRLAPTSTRTELMSLRTASRLGLTAAASAGALLCTAGVGYAFWSTTGTGTGTASSSSMQPLSVSPATIATGLYPGLSGVAGTVTVSNPNPFPVKVTAAVFASPGADAAHPGCTTTGVTFTAQSLTTPITVPGKTTSNGTASLSFTAGMDNSSSDGCQGATFTSNVTLTATS